MAPLSPPRHSHQDDEDDEDEDYTPSSTPRKKPHCKQCGRRRKGHPREGCPDVDEADNESEEITDALGSMNLHDRSPILHRQHINHTTTPGRDSELSREEDRELSDREFLERLAITVTRRCCQFANTAADNESEATTGTLGSIHPHNYITRTLTPEPEPFPDADHSAPRPDPWREFLRTLSIHESGEIQTVRIAPTHNNTTSPSAPRSPCALHTPTPSSFNPLQTTQIITLANRTTPRRTRPIRSLSMEERNAFLADLRDSSKVPPACVYVFPMQDIPKIKLAAEKSGFHACAVNIGAPDAADGWLILGRDEHAVQLLKGQVECRQKDVHHGADEQKDTGLTLQAIAGGALAVVGVVATLAAGLFEFA